MKVANPAREVIDVRAFRDIQIGFPRDIYILAVWLVLSDRVKCTPGHSSHTTLHGLARHVASLHSTGGTGTLTSQDVMEVFKQHGIHGNPMLTLETKPEDQQSQRRIDGGVTPLAAALNTSDGRFGESDLSTTQILGA